MTDWFVLLSERTDKLLYLQAKTMNDISEIAKAVLEIQQNITTKFDAFEKRLISLEEKVRDQPCPCCGGQYEPIQRTGKQLDSSLRYGAAENLYEVCPSCDYIYHTNVQ